MCARRLTALARRRMSNGEWCISVLQNTALVVVYHESEHGSADAERQSYNVSLWFTVFCFVIVCVYMCFLFCCVLRILFCIEP